jgi:hypothetical protein
MRIRVSWERGWGSLRLVSAAGIVVEFLFRSAPSVHFTGVGRSIR